MEQGWIFIGGYIIFLRIPNSRARTGMAVRMVSLLGRVLWTPNSLFVQAMDLGLNCDSSSWKIHGRDLFLPEENQHRRQIWWACCLADRYVVRTYGGHL